MYKVIQFLILLSGLSTLISSVICEGERSFNPPSPPSRLTFTHPPSFFYHLHPPPPQISGNHTQVPTREPLPLYWGMWAPSILPRLPQKRGCSQSPLPFPKGCGCKGGGNEVGESRGNEVGKEEETRWCLARGKGERRDSEVRHETNHSMVRLAVFIFPRWYHPS